MDNSQLIDRACRVAKSATTLAQSWTAVTYAKLAAERLIENGCDIGGILYFWTRIDIAMFKGKSDGNYKII